jgi:cytochrome c oxidase assembly factor CtaG
MLFHVWAGGAPSLLTSWSFEPWQLVPTAIVAALYWRRTRTLARRGTPVAGWRQFAFWLGIGLVLFALVSPIDAFASEFFFMHMLQHVLIGDLAPLCVVLGMTGPVLQPVLRLRPVNALRFLTHPAVALPLWVYDLLIWHVPFLYQAALHNSVVHAFEHICFFTAGALMWSPVVETLPAPEWFGTGFKLGYIALVRLVDTGLGNVFIWSGTVFYGYYEQPSPAWGITPLHDQVLAGTVMMIEGSLVTLAALAWLFLRLGAESELRQQLLERGLDPRSVHRAVRYGRGQELSESR